MKIVSYSEARNSFKTVLDAVQNDADVTIISRRLDVEAAQLVELPVVSAPASRLFDAFARLLEHLDAPAATAGSRALAIAPSVPAFELFVRGLVAAAPQAGETLLAQALALAPDYAAARKALWAAQTTRGAHVLAHATAGGV